MNLDDLVHGLPLRWIGARADVSIRDIVTDSRRVRPGSLFFARTGWFVDAHQFIPSAVEAGASAIIGTREECLAGLGDVPTLVSGHEDRDLGLLADRFFGHPTDELGVFAVTGTNGKTSVVYILEHLLRAVGRRPAIIGTVGHRFEDQIIPARNTTPDGLTIHGLARAFRDEGATDLLIEASSHGLALDRVAGVAVDCAALTQITSDHLDFHKSADAYVDAKMRLFDHYLAAPQARAKRPYAVFRGDDTHARILRERCPPSVNILSVGRTENDTLRVDVEACDVDGMIVRVVDGATETRTRVPLVGAHNAENVSVALGMLASQHPSMVHKAFSALQTFAGVPGRLERAVPRTCGQSAVFVDYAHTPDAVARTLVALGDVAGPLVAVIGCGGDRDRAKRPEMARAAVKHASIAVFTSDNPRSEPTHAILQAMLDGLTEEARSRVVVIEDRSEAIGYAVRVAGERPVVVMGKGHETTQERDGILAHFDDREESRRAWVARMRGVEIGDVPILCGWDRARLARACGASSSFGAMAGPIERLCVDSRELRRGDVFVALRGPRFDGHSFLPDVIRREPSAVIVSDRSAVPDDASCACIVVDDTHEALLSLARALIDDARRRHGGLKVVALTGSNGKTTTKEVCASLARACGVPTLATEGNLNNEVGLPLTVANLTPAHRVAVLEMGAGAPGDIEVLVETTHPEVAVITNVGPAHLERLGDLDGVRREKLSILRSRRLSHAIVSPSEQADAEQICPEGAAIWTFTSASPSSGTSQPPSDVVVSVAATVAATDGLPGGDDAQAPMSPQEFCIQAQGVDLRVRAPLSGAHNAKNIGAALLAVRALQDGRWPSNHEVQSALQRLVLPGGRWRVHATTRWTVIDDAYNANPSSVEVALREVAAMPGPRYAVLGAMLELGNASEAMHREVGALASSLGIFVVGVGDEGGWIVEGASPHAVAVPTAESAAVWIEEHGSAPCVILVKGSRGAALERAVAQLLAAT